MRAEEITGTTVRLRSVEARDAAAQWDLVMDAATMRRLGVTMVFTREMVEEWTATVADHESRVDYAITAVDGDEYLGEAVLYDVDKGNKSAKLRLVLRASYQDEAREVEAARLALRAAFQDWGLHRVAYEPLSIDEPGLSLARALGLREEGRLRDALLLEGDWVDRHLFARLEHED